MKFKVKSRFVNDGDGWKREVGIKILWLNPNEPDPHEWRWIIGRLYEEDTPGAMSVLRLG